MAPKDKAPEDKKKKVASADKPDKKEKKSKDKDSEKKKVSSKDKPAGKDGAVKSSKSKGAPCMLRVCHRIVKMPISCGAPSCGRARHSIA